MRKYYVMFLFRMTLVIHSPSDPYETFGSQNLAKPLILLVPMMLSIRAILMTL